MQRLEKERQLKENNKIDKQEQIKSDVSAPSMKGQKIAQLKEQLEKLRADDLEKKRLSEQQAQEQKQQEQKQQEVPAESKKKILSAEDADEIFDRMSRVQRQHITTTYAVDNRFSSMQNRIDKYGQNWRQALSQLEAGIGSFERGDKIGDGSFNDMKTTIASLSNIKNLITSLERIISSAGDSASALQLQQDAQSADYAEITQNAGGWGIWMYMLILQLIVACVFVWYKKNQDDKAFGVLM